MAKATSEEKVPRGLSQEHVDMLEQDMKSMLESMVVGNESKQDFQGEFEKLH